MDDATRAAVQPLLHDIADSEHRLRHPNAFAVLCEACGLTVDYSPRGTRVRTPEQVAADDEAEKAKAASEVAAAEEASKAPGRQTVAAAPARKAKPEK